MCSLCSDASMHNFLSGQSYCRKCWWSCSRTTGRQLGKVLFFALLGLVNSSCLYHCLKGHKHTCQSDFCNSISFQPNIYYILDLHPGQISCAYGFTNTHPTYLYFESDLLLCLDLEFMVFMEVVVHHGFFIKSSKRNLRINKNCQIILGSLQNICSNIYLSTVTKSRKFYLFTSLFFIAMICCHWRLKLATFRRFFIRPMQI